MELDLQVINAFVTEAAFSGNPAAVCVLDTFLDAALMQHIAAQNNLSETAFIVAEGDQFQLRWFTPNVEVDLCGHATLASAFVLFNQYPECNELNFHSRSGHLSAQRVGDLIRLDFPALNPQPIDLVTAVAEVFGVTPQETLIADDVVAVFDSVDVIRALSPNLELLRSLPGRGLVVTAKVSTADELQCDFVSRWFGPKVSVNEDPVTGSAHCALVPYWQQRLKQSQFTARQLSPRGGLLECELIGERVYLAGRAKRYLDGRIVF